jgi:hypothetical protein
MSRTEFGARTSMEKDGPVALEASGADAAAPPACCADAVDEKTSGTINIPARSAKLSH